ncbi:MAG: PTS glucose transporter subunit IIA [Defluviitaleaceae bacterium]|nr:PTS glucose transporter subunit IIA [Defluviitaleaceae bacterium]
MFKKFREISIMAPCAGDAIPVAEVNDPAFSQEILGKGVAIKPTDGQVFSPVDGVIDMVFDTRHAVTLVSDKGVEILIHIGLNTVELAGAHFTALVKAGDKVKIGDALINFEKEEIEKLGYDITTPIVVCNPQDFKGIQPKTLGTVTAGQCLMVVER